MKKLLRKFSEVWNYNPLETNNYTNIIHINLQSGEYTITINDSTHGYCRIYKSGKRRKRIKWCRIPTPFYFATKY